MTTNNRGGLNNNSVYLNKPEKPVRKENKTNGSFNRKI